ncbi:MAG: hypothetical protein IT323_19905 [Anaerolineae bacterium]|nr:hypothetical protein [Anaerolineae bacterium]
MPESPAATAPRLPPLTPLTLMLELALIVSVALAVTGAWGNPDPSLQLPGSEAEWLTSAAHVAALSLRDNGYLPLWQPFLEMGEPTIDNPFTFILNPISALPSLIVGGRYGIRLSVILAAVVAALGGWTLGRVMGLGALGRVLLALLVLGKGNMHAMIGTGYFQLGTSQAYMPWIIAGTLAILRPSSRRWPVVLTAIAFTLMFWAGNIWYTLPMLLSTALLTLAHMIRWRANGAPLFRLDWTPLRRMLVALVLILGLSAMSFVPIWVNRDRIGDHPDDQNAGAAADLGRVIEQFYDGSFELYTQGLAPGARQFYYSYVSPAWFLVLIFVILLPLPPLYRASGPRHWPIWAVGLFMIVFSTVWGAGGNPIFVWLYRNAPLIGQWRFVGRALAVASFWIAVLVALRVDGLWRGAQYRQWLPLLARLRPRAMQALGSAAAFGLVIASLAAAIQVNSQWPVFARPGRSLGTFDAECVAWLREQNPGRELSVWTLNYDTVTAYLENRVRLAHITADFELIPDTSTLLPRVDLTESLPEYGITWLDSIRAFFQENSYAPVVGSPDVNTGQPCLWRREDALEYAFSLPLTYAQSDATSLPRSATTPITALSRGLDRIGLVFEADPAAQVVVVQELAYPGWGAWIDGAPVRVESVGGLLGVIVPAGSGERLIRFQYAPPLLFLGAGITLVTWAFCVLFLLRAERLLPAPWRAAWRHFAARLRQVSLSPDGRLIAITRRARRFLTDPGVLDEAYRRPKTPLLPAPANKAPEDDAERIDKG